MPYPKKRKKPKFMFKELKKRIHNCIQADPRPASLNHLWKKYLKIQDQVDEDVSTLVRKTITSVKKTLPSDRYFPHNIEYKALLITLYKVGYTFCEYKLCDMVCSIGDAKCILHLREEQWLLKSRLHIRDIFNPIGLRDQVDIVFYYAKP